MTARIKNFTTMHNIPPYRIAAVATGEGVVRLADMPTLSMLGVTTDVGAFQGERIDVVLLGPAKVEFGASMVYGDHFMSDTVGRAIPAKANEKSIGRVWATAGIGAVCDCEIYGEHL